MVMLHSSYSGDTYKIIKVKNQLIKFQSTSDGVIKTLSIDNVDDGLKNSIYTLLPGSYKYINGAYTYSYKYDVNEKKIFDVVLISKVVYSFGHWIRMIYRAFSDNRLTFISEDNEYITKSGCPHEWKEYIGFTEQYTYCTKCDEKQGA